MEVAPSRIAKTAGQCEFGISGKIKKTPTFLLKSFVIILLYSLACCRFGIQELMHPTDII